MSKRRHLYRGVFVATAALCGIAVSGALGGYAQAASQLAMADQTGTPVPTATATATSTASATPKPTELTEAQKKELQARVQKRVVDQKTKLTTTQQTRIANKCVSAQGALSSAGQRMDVVRAKRTEVYGNITSKLNDLVTKLKAQNVNTTTLESQIKELNAKIDTYNTDLATYKQAVADLTALDCAKDPTAFQASLESARAALAKVRTDAAAISEYVKNTIKPTLVQIRKQLAENPASSAEGSN